MVDINLIPVALRKDGKGQASALAVNIPHEILLGVGAGVVFVLLAVHLILGGLWLMGIGRLSQANAEWQKVLPDKTTLDSLNKETGDLSKKIKIISDMTTMKSVLWAPKFNAISDHLPAGLWIRKMTLDKLGLTIEGSVVSRSQNEINNVGLLLSALRQNDGFMKDFSSLEVNSIQRGKNSVVEVTDFTVMAKLK